MNSGAAPGADGAAGRRLPIAPFVLGEQAPGAVALVTERAPTPPADLTAQMDEKRACRAIPGAPPPSLLPFVDFHN